MMIAPPHFFSKFQNTKNFFTKKGKIKKNQFSTFPFCFHHPIISMRNIRKWGIKENQSKVAEQ
jgi:hypothetical protein